MIMHTTDNMHRVLLQQHIKALQLHRSIAEQQENILSSATTLTRNNFLFLFMFLQGLVGRSARSVRKGLLVLADQRNPASSVAPAKHHQLVLHHGTSARCAPSCVTRAPHLEVRVQIREPPNCRAGRCYPGQTNA
jgi:hypothetical protein